MQDYWGLVNIETIWEKRSDFKENRGEVSFFCKTCKKISDTTRNSPKWFIFTCNICKWNNIVIGTLEWLKTNYKIK